MWAIFSLNAFLMFGIEIGDSRLASTLLHGSGGFVTAWTLVLFFQILKAPLQIQVSPTWFLFFCIIAFVALVGVLWEFAEFGHDMLFPDSRFVYQMSIADTMWDLFMDLVGVVLFLPFAQGILGRAEKG
jgi:hypothetical protein